MFYKLLLFYDENYNVSKLIFRELKSNIKLQLKSLLIITSIIFILTKAVKTKIAWLFILVFILQYIGYKIFMGEAIKLLSAKHNIAINGKSFDFDKLNKKKREDIRELLIKNEIDTVEKLKYFIELLEDNIKNSKVPNIFNKGIIVGIIGPVWIQFVAWVYQNIDNYESAIIFLLMVIICVFLVSSIYGIIRPVIIDDIINSEYNKLKKLFKIVNEIYLFELNNDKSKMAIHKEIIL